MNYCIPNNKKIDKGLKSAIRPANNSSRGVGCGSVDGCLPNVHKALGSTPGTSWTGHGGTCLSSLHVTLRRQRQEE